MAGKREKRSAKRQSYVKSQKRPRHNADMAKNPVHATKIVDLNFDCLEKIFDRLDFGGFFNLALSNKRLQAAATSAFNRKYGTKKITLDLEIEYYYRSSSVTENDIRVYGLKACLRFVRCFGEKISELVMCNGSNVHLDQYIHQYCAETLTNISFHCRPLSKNSFRKPFNRVDVVDIYDIKSSECLPRIIKWFPRMRHLMLATYIQSQHRIVAPKFPQLEHLTISIGSVGLENYTDLMRTNPKLQTIELAGRKMAMWRYLDIIKYNRSVIKFTSPLDYQYECWGIAVTVYPKDSKRLVCDHPSLVEVNLPRHRFTAKSAIIVIRQLNALQIFRFVAKNQSECDDILQQLDSQWHHEIQPAQWKYCNISYLDVKLTKRR